MRGPRGAGTGGPAPPPPKNKRIPWNSQNIQSYQASIQRWAIIGTPAKRHLNGVSLAGQWWQAFSDIWILSPLKKTKTSKLQSWAPLTKLSGYAHVRLEVPVNNISANKPNMIGHLSERYNRELTTLPPSANSENRDEIPRNATFHQGLHCLLRQNRSSEKEIQ